ncbi:hypothetical protein LAZ67_5001169, partial [Cordylochernes scorpioides]
MRAIILKPLSPGGHSEFTKAGVVANSREFSEASGYGERPDGESLRSYSGPRNPNSVYNAKTREVSKISGYGERPEDGSLRSYSVPRKPPRVFYERKRLQLLSEERIEDIVATFDFIAQRETIDYLNDHGRIVFCVRGFPGSGKESLRELLEQTYPTAKIFCAKLCPFDKDQSNRGKSHSWCKDFQLWWQDLVKTTHQKLDEEYFSKRLSKWCDYVPWYTGWFLNPADSDELFQYAIKVLDPISYALETELNLDLF